VNSIGLHIYVFVGIFELVFVAKSGSTQRHNRLLKEAYKYIAVYNCIN